MSVDFLNNGFPDKPPNSSEFLDFKLLSLSDVVLEMINPQIFCEWAISMIEFNVCLFMSGAIFKKIGNFNKDNISSTTPSSPFCD